MKKYNPKYNLADRKYYAEPLRKCINKETNAEDPISLKTRAKIGNYPLKAKIHSNQEIYSKRNNVD